MMKRRNHHPDMERRFMERIKAEHALFKFEMLSGCRREIYENCNKIRFYETVFEYFLYQNALDTKVVEAGLQTDDFMTELYRMYLKYEGLDVGTWEQTESFLEKWLEEREEKEEGGDTVKACG